MRISVNAGELAGALALAAALSDQGRIRNLVGLEAVRLAAADAKVTIAADVLDFAITLTVPAAVESPGEVAVSASRLAALAKGFLPEATIEIRSDGTTCRVGNGRSRFRLPTVAPDDLPAMLEFDEETGRVELARNDAITLLQRPAFAASTEATRFYLNGVALHDHDGALNAAATDGHRLVHTRVPGATGLAPDLTLIVPNAALKIIAKLLADKDVANVTLRCSQTLLSVETTGFVFVSKLVDATFPSYMQLIPQPSGNVVTVDRAVLSQALDRVAAVAEEKQQRVVGLTWTEGELALQLCLTKGDAADDTVDAEVTGKGRIAAKIELLAELLDRLNGDRVCIDSRGGSDPILVTDPDDADVTALLMPFFWTAQAAQAA